MTRHGSAARLLALLVLMGCAPPMEGEPCAPGSPLVILDDPAPFYGGYPVLQCTGPAGCEGEADFRWVRGGGSALTYCGCDGQTRWSDPDFGGPPTVRCPS